MKVQDILLEGVFKYGRRKTFAEILHESGVLVNDLELIEIAKELEATGMTQSTTYGPFASIRAEISSQGEEMFNWLTC
jgi:hypothetical protein